MTDNVESREPRVIPFGKGEELKAEQKQRIAEVLEHIQYFQEVKLKLMRRHEIFAADSPDPQYRAIQKALTEVLHMIDRGTDLVTQPQLDQRTVDDYVATPWKETKD